MARSPEIKVGVSGVLGRMGSTVLAAVAGDPGTIAVGGADPAATSATVAHPVTGAPLPLRKSISELIEATRPDVVVDFSNAAGALAAFAACASAGVSVVSGSTGLSAQDLEKARSLASQHSVGIISASNFALGAVLLGYLAGIASRYFDYADLIESHHEAKIDAPSGTALSIARAMVEGRGRRFNQNVAESQTIPGTRGGDFEGINVHSARMPGRVARHEVVFGGTGQTLTMIHDSINRESFMPGVLLAIKRVVTQDGLVVGLDRVLGLEKLKP
ncbi:MAG: 4-hydroxy-tetrahydrodipicolinate reductase [Chloroflexi bacterium]|nr:4-hydroxy-tetrahydrodipicolinate reductase [Chloroflexota bacterium]MDA1297429.1 4-hydroxy-tetrahydrodipicolinate reductase [Chloroflexota bacterium]